MDKLANLLDAYMSGIYTRRDVMYRLCDGDYELPPGVHDIVMQYLDHRLNDRQAVNEILRDQGLLR